MFSKMEQKVYDIIKCNESIEVKDIIKKYYKGKPRPFNAKDIIGNTVRRIKAKLEYHNSHESLESYGSGRAGKTVWIED